jgi:fructokinase
MKHTGLLELIQDEIVALMNGYLRAPQLTDGVSGFLTKPGLGARAGVLGALALAESAYATAI